MIAGQKGHLLEGDFFCAVKSKGIRIKTENGRNKIDKAYRKWYSGGVEK